MENLLISKNMLGREVDIKTRTAKYERAQVIKYSPTEVSVIMNNRATRIPRKDITEIESYANRLRKLGML